MSNRILIFCLALLLLPILGLGCKGLSETEQASIEPVTLTYWTVFGDVTFLESMAKQYNALRPYVKINVRRLRYEEFEDRLIRSLADDVQPDIVSIHNHWIRKYQNRLDPMPSSVQVANAYIKGKYAQELIVEQENNPMISIAQLRNSYVSAVAGDVVISGNIYGLPLSVDTLALYYNKELLDRAGIPEPPRTWEELLDAVQKTRRVSSDGRIIQSGIAMGTGSNIPNAPDILSLLVMQKELDMTRGNAVTFHVDLKRLGDAHPTIEALRFYTQFADSEREAYTWNNTFRGAFQEFTAGRSAFYIGYAFDQARIRQRSPQLRYEVLPMPQLDEDRPINVANYWIESVMAKSENKNVAWDFIRFLNNPDNIAAYSATTRQPSPLRSQVNDQVDDRFLGPFAQSALSAENWYRGQNIDVANDVLVDMIEGYLRPVPDGITREKRDSDLLNTAARRMQLTM
jgi:multiple sugar transport system substrate-binding protein